MFFIGPILTTLCIQSFSFTCCHYENIILHWIDIFPFFVLRALFVIVSARLSYYVHSFFIFNLQKYCKISWDYWKHSVLLSKHFNMSIILAHLSEYDDVFSKQIIGKSVNGDNNFFHSSSTRASAKACVPEDSSVITTASEEKTKQINKRRKKTIM